ncbi:hypothetical protein [Streptomyces alanosinicus]|uniref:TcpE family protein n=1 Tax=Streptomyces alanosinicus TaxID=68171 RepID=A0A918YKR6_9ACTN|nr:hypothetical protein [Streptomyces alanosinicus]GHE07353.1 hypothetical protein GCM10010339_52110 [Streptomyces alanosinicus]
MSEETVTLRDYTEAFKVKKALRKVGKANIPLKEGLFVDDIKIFALTLFAWVLAYNMILAPPIKLLAHLFGMSAPKGVPYLFVLFVPPLVAVVASRRPIRHNLGIFGLVRAAVRDMMDDPVHRRGVPVRKGHGPRTYRIVLWRARPELLPGLAPRTRLPNGWHTVRPSVKDLADRQSASTRKA